MELDLADFGKEDLDGKPSVVERLLGNKFSLFFGIFGLILVTVGFLVIVRSNQSDDKIEIISADQEKKVMDKIKVDIEGSVIRPGLYELNPGSRVNDLLIVAGGLSANADRSWVDKVLNKAQKLKDGDKFFIPEKQEVLKATESKNLGIEESGLVQNVATRKSTVNINTASLTELDTLYGIGPVTAQKIVDNRPYQVIEDLLNKKVVNRTVFGKIQDKISVY